MKTVKLLIGTTLGGAEYVADALVPHLNDAGYTTTLFNPPELSELNTDQSDIWMVVTSTHGAGDFPETFEPFVQALQEQRPDLRKIHYAIVALGDSSYDTFCEAGKKMDALLQELGAVQTTAPLEIDVQEHAIPEDAAEAWIPQWLALTS